MTEAEFQNWVEFHLESPIDDFNRIHRPAALIARTFGGGDIGKYLDWLQPPRAEPELAAAGRSQADINTMRALGFLKKGE